MKLLIVNNCYNQGSTGKIVEDLRVGLEQLGVQVCVAYGRGPKVTVPHVYRLGSSLLLKIQSLFSKIIRVHLLNNVFILLTLYSKIEQKKTRYIQRVLKM